MEMSIAECSAKSKVISTQQPKEVKMKKSAKIVAAGLSGLILTLGACSPDYKKNFASPNDAPTGFIDVAKYENGLFTAVGWSADKEDGAPLTKVAIYVDGKAAGEASFEIDRPDVAATYRDGRWLKSGWHASARIPLNRGAHTSLAISYDSKGALTVAHKDFTVE